MYLNTINKNQNIKHIIYLKNLQSIHLCMFHIPKHYYMSNMKLDMFYILNWVNRNRNHSNMICNLKHYHKCCMDWHIKYIVSHFYRIHHHNLYKYFNQDHMFYRNSNKSYNLDL